MNKSIFSLISASLLSSHAALNAETPNKIGNGADALVTCSSSDPLDYVFCQGFLRGYVSSLAMSGYSDENPSNPNPMICIPENAKSDIWQKQYVAFLRRSPGDLEVEAGVLFFGMLVEQYPCNGEKK